MEAGIIAALAYWGYHAGPATAAKIALAVAVPAAGFGFWGAVDFRRAGRLAEPLRLAQELAISGLAAAALYATGQHVLGWALAGTSVAYHTLVYTSGGRLLNPRPAEPKPLAGPTASLQAATQVSEAHQVFYQLDAPPSARRQRWD